MSLFLAAASALLIVAVVLAQRLRADVRRDSLGLRAAREQVTGNMRFRVLQNDLRYIDRLPVPPSFRNGHDRLREFQEEDR